MTTYFAVNLRPGLTLNMNSSVSTQLSVSQVLHLAVSDDSFAIFLARFDYLVELGILLLGADDLIFHCHIKETAAKMIFSLIFIKPVIKPTRSVTTGDLSASKPNLDCSLSPVREAQQLRSTPFAVRR